MNKWLEEIRERALNDNPYFIAYYGASTTSQEFSFPNWGEIIRYVLKDKLLGPDKSEWRRIYWNIHTINIGCDGASSKDLLERLDSLVLGHRPDTVIINDANDNDRHYISPDIVLLAAGKNDKPLGMDSSESHYNIRTMVSRLTDKKIKVVLTTTPASIRADINEGVSRYIEVDRLVAQELEHEKLFKFVDLNRLIPSEKLTEIYTAISLEGNDDIGFSAGEVDPVHYNAYGNAIVAGHLLKQVFDIDFDPDKFWADARNDKVQFPTY